MSSVFFFFWRLVEIKHGTDFELIHDRMSEQASEWSCHVTGKSIALALVVHLCACIFG